MSPLMLETSRSAKIQVSMTRKCHNHAQQTNPKHCEDEAKNKNSHVTIKAMQPGLYLFPSEMIAKLERIQSTTKGKKGPNTKTQKQWETQKTMNKKQQNHRQPKQLGGGRGA